MSLARANVRGGTGWGFAHPTLAPAIGAVVCGMLVGLLILFVSEQETRWLVYTAAGGIAATVIVAGGVRRVLVPFLVVGLSLNVHYYITRPEALRYVGASGPTWFSIPLVLLPAIGLAVLTVLEARAGVARIRWGFPLTKFAVLVLATAALSAMLSSVRRYGVYAVSEMLQYALLYLVAVNIIRTEEDLARVIRLLLVTLALQCTVFLIQVATGTTFSLNGQLGQTGGEPGLVRACGTVGITPSGYAIFVEPLVFSAFALWRARGSGISTSWTASLAILGAVTLMMTGNRTSWVTLCLGIVLVEILCRRRGIARRLSPQVIVTCLFVLVASAVAVIPMITTRLQAAHSQDWTIRWNLMLVAVRMIAGNPIVGVGPGGYPFHIKEYVSGGVTWLWVVHNEFLLVWAERGILGFLAWLAWIRSGLLQAVIATTSQSRQFQAFAIGCTAGIVGLLWEYMLNMYPPYACYALLWFLLGVLVAGNTLDEERRAA